MDYLEGWLTRGGARLHEGRRIRMDRDKRAGRKRNGRTPKIKGDKTVLDDRNQALLADHMASLLERLPDIDLTVNLPSMNASADDPSALSGR